jgi:general secretion pathway protein G
MQNVVEKRLKIIYREYMYKKGFTLVELMIVISIITLLMGIGITSYATYTRNARDSRRRVDLEQIRTALELYRSNNNNGTYPSRVEYGQPILVNQRYLDSVPADPMAGGTYGYIPMPVGCTNGAGSLCINYRLNARLEVGNTLSLTPLSSQ